MHDLCIKLANGHLARDIDALMPWAYAQTAAQTAISSERARPGLPSELVDMHPEGKTAELNRNINGVETALTIGDLTPTEGAHIMA